MSEREKDFARGAPAGSHPQHARRTGRSYYYDDATGYEVYNPETDDEEQPDGNEQETDQAEAPQSE